MAAHKPDNDIIPVIDISPFVNRACYDDAARAKVGELWDSAMSKIGFAIVAGHGVPHTTTRALREASMDFFAQDASEKEKYNHGPYGNPLGGYTSVGIESVSRSRDKYGSDGGAETSKTRAAPPDPVESFIFNPNETTKPKPKILEKAGCNYHRELLKVLESLHSVTCEALQLPDGYFDKFYSPHPQTALRLAYYPPISNEMQHSSDVRYGEHTDYTGYTLLYQDETDEGKLDAGGLQVKLKSGEWHAVVPMANTFVVNIGDLYEVWTNGRWRSTVHRVMKPPKQSPIAKIPRLSIPFFTGPHDEAIIEAIPTCVSKDNPAKYKPVKALDHLLQKLEGSNVE